MTISIAIVGSGPAGLIAALSLERLTRREQVAVTIFDKNKSAIDYPGVEYAIQERAIRAFERIGIRDAALAAGHPEDHIILSLARDGGTEQKRVKVDPAYTSAVLRTEFLDNLSKLLRRTPIIRRHLVHDYLPLSDKRIRIVFGELDGATPDPLDFDLVIAADGVHSVARKKWFPEAVTTDRGFSIIYFLTEGDPADPQLPEAYATVSNRAASELIMGSYVTAALFPQGRNRMTIALGYDHATRNRVWRSVGADPAAAWKAIPANDKLAITRELARDIPNHNGLIAHSLQLVADWNSPRVYEWEMRDSDPLAHPYAPDGNLVLLGDSCHAFLPTIGMGASLAMEDAERLATQLANRLNEAGDASLNSFQDVVFEPFAMERISVWHDLMSRARAAVRNWTNQGEHKTFDVAPLVPGPMGGVVAVAEELAHLIGVK